MDYYPEKATTLLEFETTFWNKATSEYTRREIKDRGFCRPKSLPVTIDVLYGDTLAGAEQAAEEAKANEQARANNDGQARLSAYRKKSNIYTANQTLLKETYAAALKVYDDEFALAYATNMIYLKGMARSKLYTHVVQTLGGYFESSVRQVDCGDAAALLNEIDRFMATDPHGKKANLIISFNAASFEKEGCNDIHKWIHYNEQTFDKLSALGETQSLESRMTVFKKTLPKTFLVNF